MSDGRWVRVTAVENIPPREGRAVLVGDRELALFNLGDRFLATDPQCPHQGGPLCDGIVTGTLGGVPAARLEDRSRDRRGGAADARP